MNKNKKPLAGPGQAKQQEAEIKVNDLFSQGNSLGLSGQGRVPSDNSAESQRQRILNWLSHDSLTTLQAREHLDVMHPSMRILELRRAGHEIQMVWVNDLSPAGKVHRVGNYFLARG